jgi:N-methylhydantoinase A
MYHAGIPSGIVPNHPGQFSAFGFIMTDARVDLERTAQMTSKAFERDHANRVLADLTSEALAALKEQGYERDIVIHRSLEMRYFGQNHELDVPIAFERFDEVTIASIWASFHRAHKARFNFDIPGETIELISIKVTAISETETPIMPEITRATGAPEAIGRRAVRFDDGAHQSAIYDRASLRAGHRFSGPAVIEEAASVTVVRPGDKVSIDRFGNILLGAIAARAE